MATGFEPWDAMVDRQSSNGSEAFADSSDCVQRMRTHVLAVREQELPRAAFHAYSKNLLIHGVPGSRFHSKAAPFVYNRWIRGLQNPMYFSRFLTVVVGGEIVDLVAETGPVAKVVLVILLAFSIVSWAIILAKWALLQRARVQSGRFLRSFRKAHNLNDVAAVADRFQPSPLVAVFEGGFEEYRRQGAVTSGVVKSATAIHRAMQIAASEEVTRFERNLPWLAITGAVTPFVGLFGTVWGIIDAFHGLGTAGAATLRAVAPGISEALITTAAGLAAAIPAVIAYNLIGNSIREFAARGDDFALEMLNTVERGQAQPNYRPLETPEVRR
jgi:biopolymer transport protein TolQ